MDTGHPEPRDDPLYAKANGTQQDTGHKEKMMATTNLRPATKTTSPETIHRRRQIAAARAHGRYRGRKGIGGDSRLYRHDRPLQSAFTSAWVIGNDERAAAAARYEDDLRSARATGAPVPEPPAGFNMARR